MMGLFIEVIIAPSYAAGALTVLKRKKNLRLIEVAVPRPSGRKHTDSGMDLKRVGGGLLVQEKDKRQLDPKGFEVVTKSEPTDDEFLSLLFGWRVVKHVKSNSIVLARGFASGVALNGVGAGQMSRVDSVKLAISKATRDVAGSVLASAAFFPFPDGVQEAAAAGVTAVVQPGGSIRDEEVIAAADEAKMAMIFTGARHFRH